MSLSYLNPDRCALMVVDIQDRLMRVIDEKDRVSKNSILLIKAAKTLNIPIIATTQYVEKIGAFLPEIAEELAPLPTTDKMEFGCFNNENVKKVIDDLGSDIDTLIICGVETHICIYQTALGALINDFRVWVPADAVSSRTKENYETGLNRIQEVGAIIANTELIIYELLQKAGTPEFKQLLPFLK